MRIAGLYRFNDPDRIIETQYSEAVSEIFEAIRAIDSEVLRTKQSKEKTKNYRMLYDPKAFNREFKKEFTSRGWQSAKIFCEYSPDFYTPDYTPPNFPGRKPYREMDFIKNRVGVEAQFGKYSFMVYNVAAKMTIFRNLGFIDVGVEIVPVKELQAEMSTGVSYYEQFVWDLKNRGVGNIDTPVLVVGIAQNR